MAHFKSTKLLILGLLFLGLIAHSGQAQDLLNLEEPPPESDLEWQVFYLKASYRSKYVFKAQSSFDEWGLPVNGDLAEESKHNRLYNLYQADSKIQISSRLSSFLRFDYYFMQERDQNDGSYKDTPGVDLWEAYLDWQAENYSIRLGGQQLKIGKVDFRSPINILNLSDPDKTAHLDGQDNSYIMPVASFHKLMGNHKIDLYWGPFQRVSEDASSLRGNFGVNYQIIQGGLTFDLGLFRWFDSNNKISLETQLDPEVGEEKLVLKVEDSPLKFAYFDFDYTLNNLLLKGDFGFFADKTRYHLYAPEGELDQAEIKNLNLKEFALALSLEQKKGDFFWLTQINSTSLYSVPANTLVLNFENEAQPIKTTRNLQQRQLALAVVYDLTKTQELGGFAFVTTPLSQTGALVEWKFKKSSEASFRAFISQTTVEENKLSGKATKLQRIQFELSLRI
ncbi:MAG: hypothetical protein QNL04_00650 [SAR324 cluster bacterium]|nr:hypothetical protein [SAR324 cluster bacterium]